MLRLGLVGAILAAGAVYALQGPFQTLLVYVWYAYFRPDYWVWDSEILRALNVSLLIGIFLVINTVLRGLGGARLNRQMAFVLLFLGWNVLSTFMSPYADAGSFTSLQDFAKAVIVGLVIMIVVDDADKLRKLLLVMGLSLGFEAAKQGWVQLIFSPGELNINDVPFLGDNNHVAVGMLMLVPLLGGLAATSRTFAEKCLHRFLVVGVIYRALSTYSRGGFLAAGGLAIATWLESKKKVQLALTGALVIVVVLSAFPSKFWERMGTIPTGRNAAEDVVSDEDKPDTQPDGSIDARLHCWRTAAQMASVYPVFGVGHASFPLAYDQFDTSGGAFGHRRAVHSAWYGVLGENGYPGLAMFVAIFVVAFLDLHRVKKLARQHESLAPLASYARAIRAALVTEMIGSAFVTFQYNEMLVHYFAIAAAVRLIAEKQFAELTAKTTVEKAQPVAASPLRAAV